MSDSDRLSSVAGLIHVTRPLSPKPTECDGANLQILRWRCGRFRSLAWTYRQFRPPPHSSDARRSVMGVCARESSLSSA